MGRAARERGDIARARETLEDLREDLDALEAEFSKETQRVREAWEPDRVELTEKEVRPRKSDISVDGVSLVWMPWRVDPDGIAEPLWRRD